VTGGTGYLGRPLITALVERGHTVRALIREESRNRLPAGCLAIAGNALDESSYATQIQPADSFVQLVGVAHPSRSRHR
jgi:nucleoside-diphosphate-sugar epimerase